MAMWWKELGFLLKSSDGSHHTKNTSLIFWQKDSINKIPGPNFILPSLIIPEMNQQGTQQDHKNKTGSHWFSYLHMRGILSFKGQLTEELKRRNQQILNICDKLSTVPSSFVYCQTSPIAHCLLNKETESESLRFLQRLHSSPLENKNWIHISLESISVHVIYQLCVLG